MALTLDRVDVTAAPAAASAPATSPAAAPAMIRIRGLTKRFGSFTALKSISLDVARGQFVCFLGPSGCGKTTLLRAIAGLDFQDEGSIEIAGRDVSRLPPAARDFGIVFQSYALFPNLSVADNVGYGLVSRDTNRAATLARVRELLALVGLPDQENKYPVQLSGGQQQRVALARALATSPSLLLLDEPLSALDARVRVRLRDEIKTLQRRLGVTTIMVTHDQEEALTMADRLVVMNEGEIRQVGTQQDLYERPADRFVAGFVGRSTFLEGSVVEPGRFSSAGGLEIACAASAAPGPAALALRPERIGLLVAGAAPPGNSFSGVVEFVSYLGAHVDVHVRLSPADRIVMEVAAHGGAALPRVGDHVRVGWSPADALVFAA